MYATIKMTKTIAFIFLLTKNKLPKVTKVKSVVFMSNTLRYKLWS